MKRFLTVFAAMALLGSLLVNAAPAFAAGPNIILNPQVAQASSTSPTSPANWKTDKWGTNTSTLSYKTNDGHNDTSSLYVQTTAFTSGDAKWYFDEIAVKPSTSYTFTDWSKSNVQTRMNAMYTSTTGAVTYPELMTVAASATAWKQNSVTFTTPANVKTMTIFHLLARVGWLQTDDFSLVDNSTNSVIAPTVSIASPTGGSTVSNITTITANPNGGSGTVSGVQFKVDGANLGAEVTAAPYSINWDTKTVADGSHTISATVRNSTGATANSTNVAVTVSNPVAPTPPTVSITAPANNATVSGKTTVTANATDSDGVAGVLFKVDGTVVGTEDTVAPYSFDWDTTAVADGTHTITATARDTKGATATATSTVTVRNIVAPTVTITSPSGGSTVSNTTTITANPNGGSGTVSGVQFKVDGANLGAEVTAAPYSINWDTKTVADGSHTISATVRNSTGATANSTNVAVTVSNPVVPAPTNNLVNNPSLETADPANAAKPDQWQSNAWGTNTAKFTYPVAGATGSRAARTEITAYTSGDAKWFFNPVAVSAGTQYTVRDMYRSNVATDVVAMYTSTTGAVSYGYLGTLGANTAWTPSEFTVTTPAGTASLSILHIIYAVGYLEVDDAAVIKVTSTPSTNPIANPSLESANGTLPANWVSSKWGTNTANFQYMNEGHTGSKSAKVTLSGYTDGDAKWFFNPITTLEKGKMYRWSTWYKTNTRPQAVAMFTRADGTEKFFGMPQPFPPANSSTTWAQYSDTFLVPQDAASVTVFLFIAGNGWVQVDDQEITPYTPTGFSRPLVTLTFDDGYESTRTNALPTMQQYGFKSTQFYKTDSLQADPATAKQAIDAYMAAGHEIASHTISHSFLTQLTSGQLTNELTSSKSYLESLTGSPVVDFAAPYGDYNEAVNNEIKKYYQSSRTVDEGYNSKDNFDPYRLRVQNLTPQTTLAEYNGWLQQAAATNTWLILVYHDVVPASPTPYGSTTQQFKDQMAALKASGLTVLTYKDALAETKAQL